MTETSFHVGDADHDRLAAFYVAGPGRKAVPFEAMGRAALKPPAVLSGGGGLVSTAHDYHRFTQFLLNRGELDGVRLLSGRTVDYMTRNHLPGGADLEAVGRPLFAETTFDGIGFGLGFAVVLDPAANKVLSDRGELQLGRRGEHGLLGRPGGGDHGDVLHPAAAVEHAPDPHPAEPAGVPGPGRLNA